MGGLCGLAAIEVRHGLWAVMLGAALGMSFLSVSGAAAAESPEGFETRVEAALGAADAALASEEARLDELAASHSRRVLADGRPSLGQAVANIRLWERQIQEFEAGERELREELGGLLKSLGPDIAELARRLSAQREQAASEQAKRKQAARQAREKVERGKAEKGRTEPRQAGRKKAEGAHPAGQVFRDCEDCPEMVVVPSGKFMMGSPASEKGRYETEGPTHLVTIGYRFAVGVHEVTRGEFGRFVSATNRVMGKSCQTWEGGSGVGWRNPGFSQKDDHPVVCVSWNDAKAYVRWLSKQTGKRYRLLSEAEWEYAARGGTTGPFHFGATISTDQANYAGYHTYGSGRKGVYRKKTAPVGSFPANVFGLHDVHGNVGEWVEDCLHKNYDGAPTDGSVWTSGGDCRLRVLRGGAWNFVPEGLRSAARYGVEAGTENDQLGFRVARTLAR